MADAPKRGLPAPAKLALFAAPLSIFAVGAFAVLLGRSWLPNTPAGPYGGYLALYNTNPTAQGETEPDGAKLYAHYCAHCHGIHGDGNGTTALTPKARHFGFERFKFPDTRSGLTAPQGDYGTIGGVPTDEHLVRLLRRGIPGSPMPSFDQLAEPELRAIVQHVKTQFIRPEPLVERKKTQAKLKAEKEAADGESDPFSPEKHWKPFLSKWLADAEKEINDSSVVAIPTPFPPSTPESIARGRELFAKASCNTCHGAEGNGKTNGVPNEVKPNDNGTRALPRDLTAGIFKGGKAPEDIYRRIYLGIPGTPMKSFTGNEGALHEGKLDEQDIVNLAHFVQTLPSNRAGQAAGK